jgi:uncharacterized protein
MGMVTIFDAAQHPVECIVSIPERARSVAILSHGFSSNKESRLYRELETILNTAGIGTVRYDYYGHGPAYGHGPGYGITADVTLSKAVMSLSAVVAYAKEKNHDIGLVGSSFGGLVSLIAAAQTSNVKAMALKSPVTDPISFWRNRLGDERLALWQHEGRMHYTYQDEDYDLEYGFWEDLQDYDMKAYAAAISCPVLIIHGEKDTNVPLEQSGVLAKTLRADVKVIAGAEHGYTEPHQYALMKEMIHNFLLTKLPR